MGRALLFLTACLSAGSAAAARASDEARPIEDASALLQRETRSMRTDEIGNLFNAKNSFLRELDDIPPEHDVKMWNVIQNVRSNPSIPKGESALAMLEEASKVFYHGDQQKEVTERVQNLRKWMSKDGNPFSALSKELEEFREWWNTEPGNRRSSSLTPAQWFRNYFGPGRKSQPKPCKFNKLLLTIASAEVVMGISASLSCNTTTENAMICIAEPFMAARAIAYILSYAQYAASWCAPTHKVDFLCGASSAESVSRMLGMMHAGLKMGGTCEKDYTPTFDYENKNSISGFLGNCILNTLRTTGYLLVSVIHTLKYFERREGSYNLEHSVRSTVFDLGGSLAWVLTLPVLMVRDCSGAAGNKNTVDKITDAKAHCWTEGGALASYILAFSSAESRRRDYCLDHLNKRGARHNAPAGTHPTNGLEKDGTPKNLDGYKLKSKKPKKKFAVGEDQEVGMEPKDFWLATGETDPDDDEESDDISLPMPPSNSEELSKPINANWNPEDPEEAVLDGTDLANMYDDMEDSDIPNEFERSTPNEYDIDWDGGLDGTERTAPLTPLSGNDDWLIGSDTDEHPSDDEISLPFAPTLDTPFTPTGLDVWPLGNVIEDDDEKNAFKMRDDESSDDMFVDNKKFGPPQQTPIGGFDKDVKKPLKPKPPSRLPGLSRSGGMQPVPPQFPPRGPVLLPRPGVSRSTLPRPGVSRSSEMPGVPFPPPLARVPRSQTPGIPDFRKKNKKDD